MVKLNAGNYVKADMLKEGDVITFANEGEWVVNQKYTYPDGNPKQDFCMKVKIGEAEYTMRVNKTNREALTNKWGAETQDWINRKATVSLVNALVSGKMCKIVVLTPINGKPEEVKAWDD